MFVDRVQVKIQAGDGGNGQVSFRREKFVDRGGPDGGDGGQGGDVLFVASRNQNTLAKFRYQKLLRATSGTAGSKRKRHGKNGEDLTVNVPVGTVIANEQGEVLADLVEDGQEAVIAQGGQGGFGNAHFISSTRQAPRVAEKGEKGQGLEAVLELKMIGDVGLIGLPNAGKSTLLATVSNAQPEIADYPFTTLTPNLGVVDIGGEDSLLFADIPGLIEGASQGKGLGDEFLRHVERTAVLLHLVDIYDDDVAQDYKTIQAELKAYRVDLTKLPQVLALNKIDGVEPTVIKHKLAQLQKVVPKKTKLLAISAKSGDGVDKLLFQLKAMVWKERAKEQATTEPIPVIGLTDDNSWHIRREKDKFIVTGQKIERFAQRTDFASPAGTERIHDIMVKMGIMRELNRQGIQPGQKISIGQDSGQEIEF